jgi:hypothetical protein
MEVSGQLKFSRFIPRERRSSYPLDRSLGGSQTVEMSALIMEPRILGRPAHSPMLPSELTGFHFSDFSLPRHKNNMRKMCTVLIWYRAETSGRILWTRQWNLWGQRYLDYLGDFSTNTSLHVQSTVQCCKRVQTRLHASRATVCSGPKSFCKEIVSTALRLH